MTCENRQAVSFHKICSGCGNVKNMSLSERVYFCVCGVNFDRETQLSMLKMKQDVYLH